jgi:hypothetical protein
MGFSTKRRNGGNALPRAKTGHRVKDKRIENAREKKRHHRRSPSNLPKPVPKRKRFSDPSLLATGMTARFIGARIQLSSLTSEEIERDIRHMEAYTNACIIYSQQFFIHNNRALVESEHFGPINDPTLLAIERLSGGEASEPYHRTLPVRIDPEEEKRISLLRKRIATSEAQREILESEYMSLRAHYVYESQRLRRTRHAVDGELKLLQNLVKKRGTVVALRRVRCAIARDILTILENRNRGVLSSYRKPDITSGNSDILEFWDYHEGCLREAELSCISIPIPEELLLIKAGPKAEKKKDKNNQIGDQHEDKIIPWNCRSMPATPEAIPILLSQMSSNPEHVAAWSKYCVPYLVFFKIVLNFEITGCGGIFGSKRTSMCWDVASLPDTYEEMAIEHEELLRLREESRFLQSQIEKERITNSNIQVEIIEKRFRNDEMCAMMTLLRSETEAVLARHNILLETKDARMAAEALHNGSGKVGSDSFHHAHLQNGTKYTSDDNENENDGDDEDEIDEEEEDDPELTQKPPNEVLIKKNVNAEIMN